MSSLDLVHGKSSTASPTMGSPEKPEKPVLRIKFPPMKDREEILRNQRADLPDSSVRDSLEGEIPPMIRSLLELSNLFVSVHSQYFRAAPGYAGGIFYHGSPYCFASGFRDGSLSKDPDDKENSMRLKDPLTYGVLSLPITAAYLCELHGKNLFDLTRPLVEYLPDLQGKLSPEATARSILSFTTVIEEGGILKDARVSRFTPFAAWNICEAVARRVYDPLNRFFAGGQAGLLSGRQQRENLVQYLRSSTRFGGLVRRPLRHARVSHFSIALLIAAVETQLKGRSFEDSIREHFFEPAQSHSAGYGPPALWKDPNEIFYQARSLPKQHQGFRKAIPLGSLDNCGPPMLNASLNLYSPVEEYAKMLMLSVDTIQDARKIFGAPNPTHVYYDFGIQFLPRHEQLHLAPAFFSGLDFIPTAASFQYDVKIDLGCFGISSCGSRNARIFAGSISHIIRHLFLKHLLRKGVDVEKPLDLDNPAGESDNPTVRKFKKITKDQEYKTYFKNLDAHKKF
ncbi:unnamed protein product [Phytomonas sp. Hart1]|nr:unnamed protein product [Phytomonas sp. Hart1]|eukprot:CCW68561.1 unnamed protein product [Phytomonas sp. isolate Hart1]